jgi:hypothetical protein
MKFIEFIKIHVGNAIEGIKWFITMCLSDGGVISFGRTLSAFWSLYFAFQDYHFLLMTRHLVDNQTLITQLSVITTSYAITKATQAFGKEDRKDN